MQLFAWVLHAPTPSFLNSLCAPGNMHGCVNVSRICSDYYMTLWESRIETYSTKWPVTSCPQVVCHYSNLLSSAIFLVIIPNSRKAAIPSWDKRLTDIFIINSVYTVCDMENLHGMSVLVFCGQTIHIYLHYILRVARAADVCIVSRLTHKQS